MNGAQEEGRPVRRGTMRAISKARIEEILTRKLKLRNPRFLLKKLGTWVSGSIVSGTFQGKRDLRRQKMIWNPLETELGEEANRSVGLLLAYTVDEWEMPLEFDAMRKVRK